MSKSKPKFVVITRTHRRPHFFHRCRDSVKSQTYPSQLITHIVTWDDPEIPPHKSYADIEGIELIGVNYTSRDNRDHFPYHGYLNQIIREPELSDVVNGWVIILDDDNQFESPRSLETIAREIIKRGQVHENFYIWKCRDGDHTVPSTQGFGHQIAPGDIQISCYAIHSEYARQLDYKTVRGDECNYVQDVMKNLDTVWINHVLTSTDGSNNGIENDLPSPPPKSNKSVNFDLEKNEVFNIPSRPKKPKTIKINSNFEVDDSPDGPDGLQPPQPVQPSQDLQQHEPEHQIPEVRGSKKTKEDLKRQILEKRTHKSPQPSTPSQGPGSDPTPGSTQNVQATGEPTYMITESNLVKMVDLLFNRWASTHPSGSSHPSRSSGPSGHVSKSIKIKDPEGILNSKSLVEDIPGITGIPDSLSVSSQTDRIYLIVSSDTAQVDRNRKILTSSGYEPEIYRIQDSTPYAFYIGVREVLKMAQNAGWDRVMIINGQDSLNSKFAFIWPQQRDRLKSQCSLLIMGNTGDKTSSDILNAKFDLQTYLELYDDIVKANLNTEDKAKAHWKHHGVNECRYAKVGVKNNYSKPLNGGSGFLISADIYSNVINAINTNCINPHNFKNPLVPLQSQLDPKTVWTGFPDLCVNGLNSKSGRRSQIAKKNGWYLNHHI